MLHRITLSLATASFLVFFPLGCGNASDVGESGGAGGGGGSNASGGGSASSSGSASTGAGGAPACVATTLADSVRITPVSISGASSGLAITAQAGSGSVVAWPSSEGTIHITPLNAVDARSADDIVVDGMEVFGVAATANDIALLVSRKPDYMTFIRVDFKGMKLAETNLIGGGDHNTVGVEWFGEFATTGRLAGRGDGTYAAYHGLHRRWPDNIGHQGDTLRLLDANGGALGGGWGWGCSHSMDQRLANGPNGLVPICIADCYPGKGIYLNHDKAQITSDPGANCAGGYSTLLGGLVATTAGFFLVYGDAQGTAHLGAFDTDGKPISDRTLVVPGSSRLASYADGMLLGAAGPNGATIQKLDATGNETGATADVSVPLPERDFEGRSEGEVAWARAQGNTLDVVRVRVCD